MTRSERPLLLGIDIEEVYDVFGEGVMIAGPGLQPAHFEMVERKAQRVRDALVDLGIAAPLVGRFEASTAGLQRAGDPLPPGMDLQAFDLAVMRTGREISSLMGEIRDGLRDEDAETYDLGVMLSRLDLCLRIVTTSAQTPEAERYVAVYLEELTRVVPIVDEMVAAVLARAEPFERSDPELRRSLTAVLDLLDRWDGGSANWSMATKARVDDAFAVLGVTGQAPPLAASAEASDEAVTGSSTDLETQLEDLRERVYRLFLDGDLDNAERGQRLLIEDCRKTVGPAHPLTLAVRNDLALTLMVRGQGDLAADRALDVADEAEKVLGARHPVTAHEQVRTLFILMATKDLAECFEFSRSRLGWLEDADPRDLDPELRTVRDELFEVTGRKPEE
jgi:hypothetical protein